MKKVLLAVPTLGDGGGEKLVFDIALNINRDLFEVYVVSFFPKTGNHKERTLESAGIKVFYLDKSLGLSLEMFQKTKKLISEINPDIIHSHLDVLIYLLPFYKKKQIKLHTVHSMAEFEAVGIHKLIRKICFKFRGVVPVAIGETVSKSISRYYNIKQEKIPCIYNGVEIPKEKVIVKSSDDTLTFVSIGTLYYIKNHKLLIEAFNECVKNTDKNIRLKIIGEGALRSELENLIKQYKLEEYVQLPGWKDSVYRDLQESDVYVCSSTVEGISLSILEAMVCGLPVIASDVGGNPDLVKDGVNGMLFESDNVSELVRCMLHMIENENVRTEQGKASLKLSKKFNIKKCTTEYERLYLGEANNN